MREDPFRRFDFQALPLDDGELDRVVAHLRAGGLVAYPTETVYGFGCALLPAALARLRELKERESDRPFLLLVPDREAVANLGWTPDARELADTFWPGALTLVLGDPGGGHPPEVRGGTGGVAVRVTSHPVAGALVRRLGAPLTSTSANPRGAAPARTADQAADAAREAGAGEEMWILDGGSLEPSEPSTIVDTTGALPRVVRPGAIPEGQLACIEARQGDTGE